jgi:hypothetical protein
MKFFASQERALKKENLAMVPQNHRFAFQAQTLRQEPSGVAARW